ncbi:alpha/beta hydrolase [Leucobacter allii]|uniref:Alpha/beta hydrolase n=1 Tax=Leucobacter allii TaxID=2932247 RepID=A0ABY4FL94_9MICO|nr:alpha/beta hydrolase [Leucobacter allii]UOQ57047.1 alpha/beta hydrolase [Leucobacter allii]UOR01559.1 alpha/beta hydrolase [Leucobacter allii]
MTRWRDDLLGPGFACTDLELGSDAEGPLLATLVRAVPEHRGWFARWLDDPPPLAGVDVLYVHGWSDYFFQRGLAHFWTSRGARFFALDLRKYGRSLRPGQTPGYIDDLAEYDAEIGLALEAIEREAAADRVPRRGAGGRSLVLFGHSTGGLILSLWSARHRGRAQGLVLNSPWLEFQLAGRIRQLITPIVGFGARINPREVAPQLDLGFYSRAQREAGAAEELAGVNAEWRPDFTHSVHAGWMQAILAGHALVDAGLDLAEPAQVLLSARSALALRWSEEMTRADTVLDVDAVARAALRLGATATIDRVDGALHDVFLSADGPRAEAYARLDRWVTGWRAAERRGGGPATQ